MKIKPVLLVCTAVLLAIGLYYGVSTQNSEKKQSAFAPAVNSTIDLQGIIASAKTQIDKKYLPTITQLEGQLSSARNPEQKAATLHSLINVWDSAGATIISAEYYAQIAKTSGTAKDYAVASENLVAAFQSAADSGLSKMLANEALEVCKRAIELDSTNDENKVNLAICLMEGKNDVMSGVQILVPFAKKNPNHLKANFILGKFAVVSGQYDKAVVRLEKVISIDKHYTAAYIILSQAYLKMGNKDKAMATLKNCKANLADETARAEVQQMIDTI